MAHLTTQRRKFAAQNPKPAIDTTLKGQPKSTLASSTVHKSSNSLTRFSKSQSYYSVCKAADPPPPPPPVLDIRLQAKAMAVSVNSDPSKPSITKSKLNRENQRTGSNKSGEKKSAKDGESKQSKGGKADVSLVGLKNLGRRRSFGDSHIELADFFSCSGVKVVSADMPPFMQIHAVDCARKTHDSLEKFTSKTLACTLKKEFDVVYGPAWHCIVGTSFGSFVTHSVGGFLYFSMDHKLYILLFKTTVQRAD